MNILEHRDIYDPNEPYKKIIFSDRLQLSVLLSMNRGDTLYSKTIGHLGNHLSYVSRNNELELEDPTGNKLTSKQEVDDLLEHWFSDADKRKNARMSVNMVLSAPKGSDPRAVKKAVRDFAQENFAHDYLFTMHDDTGNPHAHLIVKLRGYDGKKLRLGRKELTDLRQNFAQCLRERDVQVAATYRTDRGVGQKAPRQKLYNMRRRGAVPNIDKEALKEAAEALKGRGAPEPWVPAMKQRNQHIRAEYAYVGQTLMQSPKADVKTIGRLLISYSQDLPEPRTRRHALMDFIASKEQNKQKQNEKGQDR